MSILSLKLQEASKQFLNGNYPKSLEAYQECLNFCRKTDQSDTVIFNILSIKGNIEYLLGQYDTALLTLNSVLKKDSNHFLCLLRRSLVYKQKNKFKKALKDLETIQVFSPDNLQISGLKSQIEKLLITTQKQQDITSQSEIQEEEEDQVQLNFMKLKKIDRKSIDSFQMKERKSRVTILGDTTFQYKREDDLEVTKDQENVKDKAVRTYRQIQLDDDLDLGQTPVIHINILKAPKKSILKNKGGSIFIQEENIESRCSKYLGKQSHLLNLIKNIDGKIIPSAEHEHHTNPEIKEVEFRKSISSTNEINFLDQPKKSQSVKSQRKSCLRMSTFEVPHMKSQQIRRSKFQLMNQFKIDGRVITHKKRNSLQNPADVKVQLKDEGKADSQSDDSSEHNIFGSKRYFLTTQMKKQLGVGSDHNLEKNVQTESSGKFTGKKSILRKVSTIVTPGKSMLMKCKSNFQQPTDLPPKLTSLKSKKSVLFNCTL